MRTADQSPIFSKTYDLLLWLLRHTQKFPRHERFRMARRLDEACFDLYEHLMAAAHARRRRVALMRADVALQRLRLYVRLAEGLGLIGSRQYEYLAGQMTEIGRLLGGWLRSIDEPPALKAE